MSPFTHREDLQNALLLALALALLHLLECQQLALCSSGVVVIRPPAQIYHSIQVSEAILGAVVAAQTLAQPSPCVHALTKPAPATARLIPAVGGPIVSSDVLQVLNLQNWQWRYKFVVHTVAGEISALLPKLCSHCGSYVVSVLYLHVGNLLTSAPRGPLMSWLAQWLGYGSLPNFCPVLIGLFVFCY